MTKVIVYITMRDAKEHNGAPLHMYIVKWGEIWIEEEILTHSIYEALELANNCYFATDSIGKQTRKRFIESSADTSRLLCNR